MSKADFFQRLQQSPRPVVVDFWAPWCAPCRAIEPVVKKLGDEYAGRVDVWKVNADHEPELLRSLGIYGIPTVVAFHQGQEAGRHTGVAAPAALAGLFEAALSGQPPVRSQLGLVERLVRLVLGSALGVVALQGSFAGWYLPLAVIAALIAFSAVYDRCPVYNAVAGRLSDWLRKRPSGPASAD